MEIKGYAISNINEYNRLVYSTYTLVKENDKYFWKVNGNRYLEKKEIKSEYFLGFDIHYQNLNSSNLPFRELHLNRKFSLIIIIPETIITLIFILFALLKIKLLRFFISSKFKLWNAT